MTYNWFFDALFYSYGVGFAVLGLYLVIMYFVKKRLYGDAWKPWFGTIFNFLVPFLWIMTMGSVNPFAWGYGRPNEVVKVEMFDGRLFVRDFIESSGSKATFGSPSYRMHIIDPKTGDKKVRILLGGVGSIIGVKGDSLVFSYSNAVVFFSYTNGKELAEWTAETLPKIFPQLSSGINELAVDKYNKEMTITSLDGNRWTLDILNQALAPYKASSDEDDKPAHKAVGSDKDELYVFSEGHAHRLAALCKIDGSEDQQRLCGHNDVILNKDLIFLDGKIIAFNEKDTSFIVMHYETIKKLKAIFTCMSLDGKRKLWEVRQSQLDPARNLLSYFGSDESLPFSCCTDNTNDLFIISMDVEIIALRMKDGTVAWREIP